MDLSIPDCVPWPIGWRGHYRGVVVVVVHTGSVSGFFFLPIRHNLPVACSYEVIVLSFCKGGSDATACLLVSGANHVILDMKNLEINQAAGISKLLTTEE